MKYLLRYNLYKESLEEEISILKELSLDLTDNDLSVTISDRLNVVDQRFHYKDSIYLKVDDINKVFCKNYPKDDMDWLVDKPIMMEFYKKLEDFGLKRDIDYKVYGGGTTATLIFSKEGRKSIKL